MPTIRNRIAVRNRWRMSASGLRVSAVIAQIGCSRARRARLRIARPSRSEEHTSELQSLMRISYAVFCLKKKKHKKRKQKNLARTASEKYDSEIKLTPYTN